MAKGKLIYSLAGVIRGLQLLAKYCEHGEETHWVINGEHEIVYAQSNHKDDWSDEDVKLMEGYGWFWDDDVDSWARHA